MVISASTPACRDDQPFLKRAWTDHVECPLKFLGSTVISETTTTKVVTSYTALRWLSNPKRARWVISSLFPRLLSYKKAVGSKRLRNKLPWTRQSQCVQCQCFHCSTLLHATPTSDWEGGGRKPAKKPAKHQDRHGQLSSDASSLPNCFGHLC